MFTHDKIHLVGLIWVHLHVLPIHVGFCPFDGGWVVDQDHLVGVLQ